MGRNPFLDPAGWSEPKKRKQQVEGQPVSKATKMIGKRIGGALRAEFARAQKRRDSKPR